MVDGAQGENRSVGPDGRYVLQGTLGEGGMAAVFRAYDTVLDRTVAVKTMHAELGREESFRQRFRREAQAVAKLNHTNIVAVYDSGEDASAGAPVPFMVMEYVEGESLRDVLNADVDRQGAMPTEKALKITADVLAALDASHEIGLVHRDIKPANVMVTRRGVTKVMDFGIARALQSGVTSMTQTGMVVGTPQYLSPEQALGQGVDHRSDLYTTGVMLFEMLTGRLPFEADSPLSIAYHHVQTPPPSASSYNQAIPPAVDALINRALAKHPNDRFPTAVAMRAEIERLNRPETLGGNAPLIIAGGPPAAGPVPQSVAQDAFLQQGAVPPPATPLPQYAPAGGQTPPPNPYQQHHHTPAPNPYATGGQAPPPAGPGQHGSGPGGHGGHGGHGGGRKRSSGVVAVAAAIAVLLVAGVVGIVVANSGDGTKEKDPKAGPSASASEEAGGSSEEPSASESPAGGESDSTQQGESVPEGGYKAADFKACDDVYLQADGSFTTPEFAYRTKEWAEGCAERADLELKFEYEPNTMWKKDIVRKQSPRSTDTVKAGDTVTLTLSTGKG